MSGFTGCRAPLKGKCLTWLLFPCPGLPSNVPVGGGSDAKAVFRHALIRDRAGKRPKAARPQGKLCRNGNNGKEPSEWTWQANAALP